jgi:hypothetical protein
MNCGIICLPTNPSLTIRAEAGRVWTIHRHHFPRLPRPLSEPLQQANRRLLRRLLLITVAMFGFGFALVPLYDVFCEITGLNGKTAGQAATVESMTVDETRVVTVEFVASLNVNAPWEFAPRVARMEVHPGQYYQTQFHARNLTRPAHGRSGDSQCCAGPGGAAFPEDRVLLLHPAILSAGGGAGHAGDVPRRSGIAARSAHRHAVLHVF